MPPLHDPAGGINISSGTATIHGTTITGNSGNFVGGIWLSGAVLRLSASTLTNNTGSTVGGIYATHWEGTEPWVEDGTRIGMPGAGNTGGYVAGYGIFPGGIFTKAYARISDSYVEANNGIGIHAQGGIDGGGVSLCAR